MVAKFGAIQEQLEQAAGRKAAVSPVAANAPDEARARRSPPKPTKPESDVHIGAYLPADFKRSLMLVRAETGEDVKTLLARALNELFRAHKVPVVDRPEPKDSPMTAHLRLVGPDLEKRTVAKGRPAGRRPNHELRFAQRQVRPHGATGLRWARVAV